MANTMMSSPAVPVVASVAVDVSLEGSGAGAGSGSGAGVPPAKIAVPVSITVPAVIESAKSIVNSRAPATLMVFSAKVTDSA